MPNALKPSIKTVTVRNLITFLLILSFILLVVTGFNFRALSTDAIKNRALAHAELVKSGLTAQMKAGVMDKRDYYLEEIRKLHEVNRLSVIRGDPVIAQFGVGKALEVAPDEVAQQALDTAEPVFVVRELTRTPFVRAIIPYVARSEGRLNCLGCHQVEEGAVLGAVDIELDLVDYRNQSFLVLGGILIVSGVFLVLILINTSHTIQQHVKVPLETLIQESRAAYKEHLPVSPDHFSTQEFTHVADEINLFNSEIISHQDELQEKNKALCALNNEIETTVRETVYTMGVIEEQRSKETNNHTKRVSSYCRLVAEDLGLPPREIELVAAASPLHDLGKLGIPDRILLKPGRLTPVERDIMKNHTRIGYAMLRHSTRDILRAGSIIALQHHEKWDGSGYPQGLAGEDIHIFGRIVALADVFDALISKRVYKESWEVDRVVDWIAAQRGKHFAPDLVDIFLNKKTEFLAIYERYPTDVEEDVWDSLIGTT